MTFLPRARIKYQSAGFGVIFQVMNDLNSILLFYVNMFLRNFYLAYGSINPIGPQQHFVHRIVSQALDSFIVVFCAMIIRDNYTWVTFYSIIISLYSYLITFNDVFNGTLRFVTEFDAENVPEVMVTVGEKQFPCCSVICQGRQFWGIVRLKSQCSVRSSIGEKFELIVNGDDEIW